MNASQWSGMCHLPKASRLRSTGSAGNRVVDRTPSRAAKRSVRVSAASVVICLSTCTGVSGPEQLPMLHDTGTAQPAWSSIPST